MSGGEALDERARQDLAAYYAARAEDPNALPYIGPEDIYNRFMAGEVVTQQDMLTDQSLFTVRPILPSQMKRLRWMLDNLTGAGSP
jgi:hypothetical protein